jgi:hypothetical protein
VLSFAVTPGAAALAASLAHEQLVSGGQIRGLIGGPAAADSDARANTRRESYASWILQTCTSQACSFYLTGVQLTYVYVHLTNLR